MDHHRAVNVELKVARSAADVYRDIVTHHLTADHSEGLALGRVNLARHNRRPRFIFRDRNFADAAARTGGQPAHIVGDFHQRSGQPFQRAVGMHQRINGRQRFKLVRRGHKRLAAQGRQLGGDAYRVFRMGIKPGSHRRAAQRQFRQMGQAMVNMPEVMLEHGDPS